MVVAEATDEVGVPVEPQALVFFDQFEVERLHGFPLLPSKHLQVTFQL